MTLVSWYFLRESWRQGVFEKLIEVQRDGTWICGRHELHRALLTRLYIWINNTSKEKFLMTTSDTVVLYDGIQNNHHDKGGQ